jgi:hypothetical protein
MADLLAAVKQVQIVTVSCVAAILATESGKSA